MARDDPVTMQTLTGRELPVAVAKPQKESELNLLEIGSTLWRGKLLIASAVAVAGALGIASVLGTTPNYLAQTEMALEITTPPVMEIQAVVQGFTGDEASINTEMSTITSGEMIRRLVEQLDLVQDPEFNPHLPDPDGRPWLASAEDWVRGIAATVRGGAEAEPAPITPEQQLNDTVDAVREIVTAEDGRATFVFTISATTTDPVKSTRIVNTLAQLYRDDQIRQKVETTDRMANWLSDRVTDLRGELDTQQAKIADLQARTGLVSAESLAALNQQAIDLSTQLREAQGEVSNTDRTMADLQAARTAADLVAAVAPIDDGQLAASAAAAAEGDGAARARFDRRLDQLVLQAQAERDRATKLIEDLERRSDQISTQFESQSNDLQALQQLQQEVDATQILYETFLTRLRETTVQESVHQADSRVLTEATDAERIKPRPVRTLIFSILAGLLVGSGLVLAREFMQNTFRTSEDIERTLARPVLGQIPIIPSKKRFDTLAYLRSRPTSAAAEAVRNLRTSLLLSSVDRPPKIIMMTSSVPSEGKTTISIALAQNLAGLGKRVLLMEGDIRRRTFTNYFPSVEAGKGILAAVSGETALADAVIHSDEVGADVLLGDRSTINAADLFSSAAFKRMLDEARAAYDYVVIDTPPVLVVPDARVIAQYVDATVYVVHWDRTVRSQVEEGARLFQSVNVSLTGYVLSRVDPKGMRRYGYGGRYGRYGAYSRYGYGYYTN